ncbi:thioredoxin family protein [Alkalitalea saponilacus]|uniref:Thioredoxin n=1 Tax=Alkalitalea saponilacus TaxID=889453 RepID=A0A1T5BI80_9BACT|nr:thioredoxin family protein [Alkalitalea saponilacus]ASB49678.1 thiol reductase thioredoxin [Alkalitalea saponilacus]SKB46994.1 Thioredoxin [Alkalitalea saponilacus]
MVDASVENIISENKAVLIYFSHNGCNVCKVLQPKVKALLGAKYPRIAMMYCDVTKSPEIAAQYSVFAVPTVVVLFEGNEVLRFSRNMGIGQLDDALSRPYKILFDD